MVSLSDEEPKNPGTVDQWPILMPMFEHNSERRFVLVVPSETEEEALSDDSELGTTSRSTTTGYAANTKIKVAKDGMPELQRRRSRADLPRLETEFQQRDRPRPTAHRSRSATCVDPKPRDAPRDYFAQHPESARSTTDAFLSPDIIKHATKGRDRAYWNFNSGSNVQGPRDPSPNRKPNSGDRKGLDGYARSSPSARLGAQRRFHSDLEVPQVKKTTERHSSYRDETHGRTKNDPSPPSLERRQSPPRLSRKETRRETSPARRHAETQKRREKDRECSSDENRERRSRHSHRNRRKSTVIHEDRPALLSPAGPRPIPVAKSKSKPPSPLPSPKSSQARISDHRLPAETQSSTTFKVARDRRRNEIERPVSPVSSGGSSISPRTHSKLKVDDRDRDRASDTSRPEVSSRTPSIRSNASSNKPVNAPPPVSTATLPLTMSMPPSPAWSRQGSLETIPQRPSHWQPGSFQPPHQSAPLTPRQSGTDLQQPGASVTSYRRYSEDVNAGTLPGLPDCPRQRPRAGLADWLTLPKYDNFNICPSCYEQVFYPTEFRDLLVPAPIRSRDKEIACDLGTSPWFRIAWLMTRKYRRNDLRLLQGIADVSTKNKAPCYGPARVTRVWYSIIDPQPRRCISDFTVCGFCADAMQTLFPSLIGVFVPLDRRAEPRSGKCSLHFAPNRNRFVTYFDVFESTHDDAMANHSVPNIQRLADTVNMWTGIEECPRDEPIRQNMWYTMANVPEVTACEECFMDVVYPQLVADANAAASERQAVNSVARNFYQKPQLIRCATVCEMASPWMRDLFHRACRREDGLAFLDSRVAERLGT